MERTWALSTADLGSKVASSVKLECWLLVHKVADNRECVRRLLSAMLIYLFSPPWYLNRRKMTLGGAKQFAQLRSHSWWGHCWNLNTLLTLPYNTSLVGVALGVKLLSSSSYTTCSTGQFPLPFTLQEKTLGCRYGNRSHYFNVENCEVSFSGSSNPLGPQTHGWPRKNEGISILLPSLLEGIWGCRWEWNETAVLIHSRRLSVKL